MNAENGKVVTDNYEIWLDENKVVRLKMVDGFELGQQELEHQFKSYTQLGIGPRNIRPILIEALGGFSMDKQVSEMAASMSTNFFNACAVVSDSLAARIMVNFLNSRHIFGMPIRMFATEAKAMAWMQQFM